MVRTKRSKDGDALRITKSDLDQAQHQHQEQQLHEHEQPQDEDEDHQLRKTPPLEDIINSSGPDSSPTASTKAARKRRHQQHTHVDATQASTNNSSSPPATRLHTPRSTHAPPRPPSLTSAKYEGISLLYGMGPPIKTDSEMSSPTLKTKAGQRQQQQQQQQHSEVSVSSSPPVLAPVPGIGDWLEQAEKLRNHDHKLHDHDQRIRDLESENRVLMATVLRLQKQLEEFMGRMVGAPDDESRGSERVKERSCSESSSEPVILDENEPADAQQHNNDNNEQDEEEEDAEKEDAENKDPLKHITTPPRHHHHAQRRVASNREGHAARQPMAQLPLRQFYSSPSAAADIETNLLADTDPFNMAQQPGGVALSEAGGRSSTPKRHRHQDYDQAQYGHDYGDESFSSLHFYNDEGGQDHNRESDEDDDEKLGGGKVKRHEARAPGSTTRR